MMEQRSSQGTSPGQINRRLAMAGAVAGLAAFGGLAHAASAQGAVDGIAGGGLVPLADGSGSTQFSLAVIQLPDAQAPVLAGSFVLYDAHAEGGSALMQSISLAAFKAYAANDPNARQLTGNLSVNGDGSFPFLLQVAAAKAGQADTFNLVVGQAALPYLGNTGGVSSVACNCAAYSYALKGALSSGKLHLVT